MAERLCTIRIKQRNETRNFKPFSRLPAEIRIQIWEDSFVPRRLILRRHTSRPALSIRSSAALLLVNNEAHRVFVENYTYCLHALGQRGIYINFALDTLSLKSDFKALRKLFMQYPSVMNQVQWIDIRPDSHALATYEKVTDYIAQSSLRLITLGLSVGSGQNRSEFPDTSVLNTCLALALMKVDMASSRHNRIDGYVGPSTAAIFRSEEVNAKWLHQFATARVRGSSYVALKQASPFILDPFEFDLFEENEEFIPRGWDNLLDCNWFAQEFEFLPRDDGQSPSRLDILPYQRGRTENIQRIIR